MNHGGESKLKSELNEIRESANAGFVPPRHLLAMPNIAAGMQKNAAMQRLFYKTMESLESCGILSRMDSHHWDLGLCELESDGGVVCVSEGTVLCFDGETAAAYSPEEVRKIGGAKPD